MRLIAEHWTAETIHHVRPFAKILPPMDAASDRPSGADVIEEWATRPRRQYPSIAAVLLPLKYTAARQPTEFSGENIFAPINYRQQDRQKTTLLNSLQNFHRRAWLIYRLLSRFGIGSIMRSPQRPFRKNAVTTNRIVESRA
jgi:hypothetical protein